MIETHTLNETLDWAHYQLEHNPQIAHVAVTKLNERLSLLRYSLTAREWDELVGVCRRHPVRKLIHEDPLTERSYAKPRGYQGDAKLLDIIYKRDWRGIREHPVTARGEMIFNYTIDCKAPAAVRYRGAWLARMIDEVAAKKSQPHVLSVACGHLRELRKSNAFCEGRIARMVGLDQDKDSLMEIEREWPAGRVETVAGSIKHLFGGPLARQEFDFIYAAGLYDYLDKDLAQRLTARMFSMVNPGGRLLVANYQTGIEDVGYMEAFMDWRLIYRNAAEMGALADTIPEAEVANRSVYADPSETIVFLQLERRS